MCIILHQRKLRETTKDVVSMSISPFMKSKLRMINSASKCTLNGNMQEV